MPEVELLATGEGDYRLHDPDALRARRRDRKQRDLVDKTTTAADAAGCLLAGEDSVSFGSSFAPGPRALGILSGRSGSCTSRSTRPGP
jgi:hypothetical protein